MRFLSSPAAMALAMVLAGPGVATAQAFVLPVQVAVSPSASSSLAVPGPHTLISFTVTHTTPLSGTVMVFDAPAAPADGSLSGAGLPLGCWAVPVVQSPQANWSFSMANVPLAPAASTGIVVVASSNPSCRTLAKQSADFISVLYQ